MVIEAKSFVLQIARKLRNISREKHSRTGGAKVAQNDVSEMFSGPYKLIYCPGPRDKLGGLERPIDRMGQSGKEHSLQKLLKLWNTRRDDPGFILRVVRDAGHRRGVIFALSYDSGETCVRKKSTSKNS